MQPRERNPFDTKREAKVLRLCRRFLIGPSSPTGFTRPQGNVFSVDVFRPFSVIDDGRTGTFGPPASSHRIEHRPSAKDPNRLHFVDLAMTRDLVRSAQLLVAAFRRGPVPLHMFRFDGQRRRSGLMAGGVGALRRCGGRRLHVTRRRYGVNATARFALSPVASWTERRQTGLGAAEAYHVRREFGLPVVVVVGGRGQLCDRRAAPTDIQVGGRVGAARGHRV